MLTVDGLDRLQHIVLSLDDFAERRAPTLLMSVVLLEAIERIENEVTAPDGTPWKRWSDDYAKTRTADTKLLRDTGDLRDSLYLDGDGTNQVDLLSSVDYAGFVHDARPFAGLSYQAELDWGKLLVHDFDWRTSRV